MIFTTPESDVRRLAFVPTAGEVADGARETREKLDHTLRAYARLERRNAELIHANAALKAALTAAGK